MPQQPVPPANIPFPPESQASNFNEKISSDLEYTKEFVLPDDFRNQLFQNNSKKRLLLHFGAVDQIAEVYVNGQLVGKHEGGYLPFSMDITDVIGNVIIIPKLPISIKFDKTEIHDFIIYNINSYLFLYQFIILI